MFNALKIKFCVRPRGGNSVELSYGLVNMGLIYEELGWNYVEFFHTAKAGYSYQFNDWFSFGGDIGVLIVPPDNEILTSLVNPLFGIQAIFGNKVDGFAGSIGIDVAPRVVSDLLENESLTIPFGTLGLFYRNFFIKASFFKVKLTQISYLEAGYSIYLGK